MYRGLDRLVPIPTATLIFTTAAAIISVSGATATTNHARRKSTK